MYALIDCNNFYASCERLFRPDLKHKPIIVLSSNDGCVIARSDEAKTWIQMGEPYFKIRALCHQYHIQVFSSNFALYRDLSQRVMAIIESAWPEVEIYSVDEAFLDLSTLPSHLQDQLCHDLQRKILKCTGIPTSIGLGPTKTLAKAANYVSKKILKRPVFNITQQQHWLKHIPIGDIWGIGRQSKVKLQAFGIQTAFDLATTAPQQLKHQFYLPLRSTALELQGIRCWSLATPEARLSIISSRSFGEIQTTLDALTQALSHHCANAYIKLRQQHSLVQSLYVFVRTSFFRQDLAPYANSAAYQFMVPSDDIRTLTKAAIHCLQKIYKPNLQYKKVGVCFDQLCDKTHQQLSLLEPHTRESNAKKEQLLQVFDLINYKFGSQTIKLASEGYQQPWAAQTQLRSPRHTTEWGELRQLK